MTIHAYDKLKDGRSRSYVCLCAQWGFCLKARFLAKERSCIIKKSYAGDNRLVAPESTN